MIQEPQSLLNTSTVDNRQPISIYRNSPLIEIPSEMRKYTDLWEKLGRQYGFTKFRYFPAATAHVTITKTDLAQKSVTSRLETSVLGIGLDYLRDRVHTLEKIPELIELYFQGKILHERGHVIIGDNYHGGLISHEGEADLTGFQNTGLTEEQQNDILAAVCAGDWIVLFSSFDNTKGFIRRAVFDRKEERYNVDLEKKYIRYISEDRKKRIFTKAMGWIEKYLS